MNIATYLRQLLSMHWLRPETALWRTFDCLLMEEMQLTGKTVDLGCGDGTLSYIMAGGKISNHDSYRHVASLDSYNQGSDIYNKLVNENEALDIDDSSLKHRYHFGIDHKDGLISKANMLGDFYENTLVQDLNRPLPFADGTFDAAFSNILYWLDDLNAVLSDWRRVLSASGRLVLFVPNDTFKKKAWLYYSAPHEGSRAYLNYFDRGYNSLIHHAYNHLEWETLFKDTGFTVVKHVGYLTDPVMEIWNIGTRPISPLLIEMAALLPTDKRDQIKEEWISYFSGFLYPIITGEFGKTPREGEYAFHFYILEKRP